MRLALAAGIPVCLALMFCPVPVAAQATPTPAMRYAIGVVGGASLRGPQVAARVNVGLGRLVGIDAEVGYWAWTHFDDQDRLTVGGVQVRIGPRDTGGWHVVGLVGGSAALDTTGYTVTGGVGIEREYVGRRISIDVRAGMYTAFVNVGVLFGPRASSR
jgi:hypothetical protein